jgi:GNAT superfamily N-acetyltransferase
MELQTRPLGPQDRAAWEPLARGYKLFYKTDVTDAEYDLAWRRLIARERVFGMVAVDGGRVVGIAHYLFHASTWAERVCYLQDLFVAPEARGRGAARALISAVALAAQASGAARYYWLTQEDNAAGRALYDKVARFNGFIRYDFPLDGITSPPHVAGSISSRR